MTQQRLALYVVSFELGDNAMTQRAKSTCAFLKKCGLRVEVMCVPMIPAEREVSEEWMECDRVIYPFSQPRWSLLAQAVEGLSSQRALHAILDYCEEASPSLIVMYGGGISRSRALMHYSRRSGASLLVEETDWLWVRPPRFHKVPTPRALLSITYGNLITLSNNASRRFVDHKAAGQITVSEFLRSYYYSKGGNPVLVPMLASMDYELGKVSPRPNREKVRLIYAGNPGKFEEKDMISPLITALERFESTVGPSPFQLDIIGMEEDDVYRMWTPSSYELGQLGIYVHGRKTHEATIAAMREADFGVLIRHNQRYAKAGFATKLVEYLSCGLPVICNSVGGADLFIEDAVDGFVASQPDASALFSVLLTMACMSNSEIDAMRLNAVEKARSRFLPEAYEDDFRRFIEDILGD